MSLANLTTTVLSPQPLAHEWVPSACPAMQAVERIVANIGGARLPILLLGEPGSGKEALARHIHRQSSQGEGEWCHVDCPGETAWSFTRHLARFDVGKGNGIQSARQATLFLDGVEHLNEECQALLLRALADPAGDNGTGHGVLAARLVCAANGGLEERLTRGQFGEELYFRISGICLRIPPLRHRREDILPLLDLLLNRMAEEQGQVKPILDAEVRDRVLRYTWPGNLRELERFARRALVLEDASQAMEQVEGAVAFAPGAGHSAPTPSLKEVARAASRQAEKELILKTLTRTRWNRKRAAEELQISYKALLYKLKEICLEETTGERN